MLVRGREPLPRLEQVLTELPDTRITVELKSGAAVAPVLDAAGAHRQLAPGLPGQLPRRLAGPGPPAGRAAAVHLAGAGVGVRAAQPGLAGRPALARPAAARPPVIGNLAQLPRRFGRLTVVDPALLRAAHASGREVHVWTVNDPAEMAELLDLGVDGLLSDRPDLLRELLERPWPLGHRRPPVGSGRDRGGRRGGCSRGGCGTGAPRRSTR